jgi:hypothetical protein
MTMIYACLTIAGLALAGNILLFLALVGLHTRHEELFDLVEAHTELIRGNCGNIKGTHENAEKIFARVQAIEKVTIPSYN